MADAWSWSKSRTERFVSALKKRDRIGTSAETGITVVTICNYDDFQPNGNSSGTPVNQKRDSSGTAAGQQRDKPNKGVIREKEGKEDITALAEPDLFKDPADDLSQAFDIYNAAASKADWPQCEARNQRRKSKLKARLKECGGVDGWRFAMEKALASDFLCNRASKPFRATIDFLLQQESFTKLMEGNYDDRSGSNQAARGPGNGAGRPGRGTAEAAIAVATRRRAEQERGGGDLADPFSTGAPGMADGPGGLFAQPLLRKGDAPGGS
jgi:hypothetical protein